ncbi:hypothetical protein DFJ63DRAFT_337131 [Scheffersomyces coipomensis]|uniref:uncharacterized protein n=1 Tax=Scheffersomyces coipomensis TaxID=1788519 RepID=UPI00315DD711
MTVGSTSTDIDLGVMETPSPSNSSKAITNEIKMTDLAQSIQQITLDLTYIKSRFEVHFNSKPKIDPKINVNNLVIMPDLPEPYNLVNASSDPRYPTQVSIIQLRNEVWKIHRDLIDVEMRVKPYPSYNKGIRYYVYLVSSILLAILEVASIIYFWVGVARIGSTKSKSTPSF